MFQFQPGDVIVFQSTETGLYRKLKDWLLGSKWGHVAIFYDYTKMGLPLLIESIGRGVEIRSVFASEGRNVVVMRHPDPVFACAAAKTAEHIADTPSSWYDFWCIPRYVLPRLIWFKLTGRRYGFGYWHNPTFICSELVDEALGFIVPKELVPPLPGDFFAVPILANNIVFEGTL